MPLYNHEIGFQGRGVYDPNQPTRCRSSHFSQRNQKKLKGLIWIKLIRIPQGQVAKCEYRDDRVKHDLIDFSFYPGSKGLYPNQLFVSSLMGWSAPLPTRSQMGHDEGSYIIKSVARRTMNSHSGKKVVKVAGIDLAKNSFQLHGVDGAGNPVMRKKLTREKPKKLMINMPQCRVAIYGCPLLFQGKMVAF